MKYRIHEIFYSLQGEGYWSGTPMVFVRFSGCNLRCPFCDTPHEEGREMTAEEVTAAAEQLGGACRRVCLTGGEPSLQIDRALIEALHSSGYRLHIETNGTRPLPEGIDWITLSPKAEVPGLHGDGTLRLQRADELKLVYTGGEAERWTGFAAQHFFLQPCSGENTEAVVEYVLQHPRWRLSLQIHKYLNIK